jgi:hypothetical protein
MNKTIVGLIVSIVVIAIILTFYIRRSEVPPPVTIEIEARPQLGTPIEEGPPPVQYPVTEIIPEGDPPKPLPALDESDPTVEDEFNGLVSNSQLSELLLFKTFIRNFVVIVDNLTARILPQKFYFFRQPPGSFLVRVGEDAVIYLDPENFKRYTPYVDLVNSLDFARLIEIYRYLYPLFQDAYEELGYPDRYFNDRLIEIIASLLQTPEIQGPVVLVQPTVYYKFADPELEAMGAGQKLLIRIGPENAAIIKARLRYMLEQLTTLDRNNR